MATAALTPTQVPPTLVPVEVYLTTMYHPDVDYLEGELKERNVGEQPHAILQGIFAGIFREHRKDWLTRVLPEQRVQVAAERFRIPDLCVLRSSDSRDGTVRTPPLLCIEILSSADTLGELQKRVDDYQRMGVEHIWAVDPWERKGYVATTQGFLRPPDDIFTVPGTPIRIVLAEVLAEADES